MLAVGGVDGFLLGELHVKSGSGIVYGVLCIQSRIRSAAKLPLGKVWSPDCMKDARPLILGAHFSYVGYRLFWNVILGSWEYSGPPQIL